MEKDKTIVDFINKLKPIVNFTSLEIVDYWDADLCAIGIKKGDRLIYISTFNYISDKVRKYDYDLEVINKSTKDKIRVLKEGRGVLEDELIAELKTFLQI